MQEAIFLGIVLLLILDIWLTEFLHTYVSHNIGEAAIVKKEHWWHIYLVISLTTWATRYRLWLWIYQPESRFPWLDLSLGQDTILAGRNGWHSWLRLRMVLNTFLPQLRTMIDLSTLFHVMLIDLSPDDPGWSQECDIFTGISSQVKIQKIWHFTPKTGRGWTG